MSHDDGDDKDLYDISVEKFDEVTQIRHPTSDDQDEDFFRLYDEEANTLIYTTLRKNGADDSVTMALRDASAYAGDDESAVAETSDDGA
jgi:hypothetical protein